MLIDLEREPFKMAPVCPKPLSLAANSDNCITVAFKDVNQNFQTKEYQEDMREITLSTYFLALDVIAQIVKKTPQLMNTVLLMEVYSDK
jgi:hypothetical protein